MIWHHDIGSTQTVGGISSDCNCTDIHVPLILKSDFTHIGFLFWVSDFYCFLKWQLTLKWTFRPLVCIALDEHVQNARAGFLLWVCCRFFHAFSRAAKTVEVALISSLESQPATSAPKHSAWALAKKKKNLSSLPTQTFNIRLVWTFPMPFAELFSVLKAYLSRKLLVNCVTHWHPLPKLPKVYRHGWKLPRGLFQEH